MTVTYKFLDNKHGALIQGSDTLDGDEMLSVIEKIFKDEEDVKKYKYGIVDYSNVKVFNMSHKQIYSLAKIHLAASKLNSNIIVGFAINNNPLVYGLVRIWMTYAELTGWKLKIKKDLPSIQKWIEEQLAQSN